ncbi:hypothetical protein [Comamonas sp.]|uniref:hypothetical protein n=1 Tax=Comamonas sp. TaxID=34028 RepID=UPI00258C2255|nr:hypothetical protein [Comamonas sp.]
MSPLSRFASSPSLASPEGRGTCVAGRPMHGGLIWGAVPVYVMGAAHGAMEN